MRRDGSVNRFLRETSGASFVEFTAIFPMLMLLIMGAIIGGWGLR